MSPPELARVVIEGLPALPGSLSRRIEPEELLAAAPAQLLLHARLGRSVPRLGHLLGDRLRR